jgi:hypothetical protein
LGSEELNLLLLTENGTLRAVLQGSFLSFRSVSTKESYQTGPPRAPESTKSLTLTFTKQALSE